VITALAGALMVSHLAFYSFKEFKPGSRISFTFALAIPLTLVLIALDPPKVLFTMAAGYAISGPLVTLWRQRRAKQRKNRGASET
jgi:CDP-diacylglycerol--serine O-phosphatidyltransferase